MTVNKIHLEILNIISLSIVTVLAFNFWQPTVIQSYVAFITLPALLGYVSFVSKEGFRISSIASITAVFFGFLSLEVFLYSLVVFTIVILTSFFGGGKTFTQHFKSFSLPLFFTAILVSLMITGIAITNESTEDVIIGETSEKLGGYSELIIESVDQEDQENQTKQLILQVSTISVAQTQEFVIQNTSHELSVNEIVEVQNSFQMAQNQIPKQVLEEYESELEDTEEINPEEKIENLMRENYDSNYLYFLIPIVTFGIYLLQPIIGILVALFGSLFGRISSALKV